MTYIDAVLTAMCAPDILGFRCKGWEERELLMISGGQVVFPRSDEGVEAYDVVHGEWEMIELPECLK